MAALTAVRDDHRKGPNHAFSLVRQQAAAGVVIYKGGAVVIDTDGNLRPARNNNTDVAAGVAFESFDNSGKAAGALDRFGFNGPRVWKTGNFVFNKASAVQTDVGKDAYLLDDQTVGLTVVAGQRIGTIQSVRDTGSVRVLIDGKVA